MLCFLCGKKIGLLRRLADQQYCCAAHRKEAKLASAQAYREEDDVEHWSVMRSKDKKKGSARPTATTGPDRFDLRFPDRGRSSGRGAAASRTWTRRGVSPGFARPFHQTQPADSRLGRGGRSGAESGSRHPASRVSIGLFRLGHGEFPRFDEFRRSGLAQCFAPGFVPSRFPAFVGAFFFPSELPDGVPGPDGRPQPELGVPRGQREQLLRHQAGDRQARSRPQCRTGALCRDRRARISRGAVALAAEPGARRQLSRPHDRAGRPLHHLPERPGDQLLDRYRAQARRSGLLRGPERSAKGRLDQRLGTRQLHGPHAGPLLAVRESPGAKPSSARTQTASLRRRL